MSAQVKSVREALAPLFSLNASGFGVLAITVVVVALYFPSFAWLAGEWATTVGDFSHGFLVAAISAGLLIRALPGMEWPAHMISGLGVLALLITSLMWLLSRVASVAQVETAMLPLILMSALYAAYGRQVLSKLSFPVLYLYFATPIWGQLVPFFQQLTIDVVHLMIRLVDISVYVEGDFVHLPNGTFEVAGGCSGLAFILTATAVATLYGFLYYRTLGNRVKLFAIALAMSVVLNWVRVFLIVVVGNAYQMRHFLVDDHLSFGWALFAVMLVPLFFVANRLHRAENTGTDRSAAALETNDTGSEFHNFRISTVLVSMILVAVAPAWAMTIQRQVSSDANVELKLPILTSVWTGPGITPSAWRPSFEGVDAEIQRSYASKDARVWLYANVYIEQRQGKELIFFRNDVAGTSRTQDKRIVDVDIPGFAGDRVVQLETTGPRGRWSIWYWYEVGNSIATRDTEVKLLQAVKTLTGGVQSGVIAVAAKCHADCEAARVHLEKLIQTLGPGARLEQMVVVR
jgi:EpsI family protein